MVSGISIRYFFLTLRVLPTWPGSCGAWERTSLTNRVWTAVVPAGYVAWQDCLVVWDCSMAVVFVRLFLRSFLFLSGFAIHGDSTIAP